jgi:hypothetical protein
MGSAPHHLKVALAANGLSATAHTEGLGNDALGIVALIPDKVVISAIARRQEHPLEPSIENVLLAVGEVHVDRLELGLLGLETTRLEMNQHDDMIITRISTERLGHPCAVERVAVPVLLAIEDGGQIVRYLCILFFGRGALDGNGFLGFEDHDREMGVVDRGLGLGGREDGARRESITVRARGGSRFLRSFLGARALTMTLLLLSVEVGLEV